MWVVPDHNLHMSQYHRHWASIPPSAQEMDDMATEDAVWQYAPLGSIFIAIAIVVWTSIAVWLCDGGPPSTDRVSFL